VHCSCNVSLLLLLFFLTLGKFNPEGVYKLWNYDHSVSTQTGKKGLKIIAIIIIIIICISVMRSKSRMLESEDIDYSS